MNTEHIKRRLDRLQASIAIDVVPPRIVGQPPRGRLIRLVGAWRRVVATFTPGALYRSEEMKLLDAMPLLERGLSPERYLAAMYARLPSGPGGQSVGFHVHGQIQYIPDAHVPAMMPRLYVVRDENGEAWSKMIVDYPERVLRHDMQNKMRRIK